MEAILANETDLAGFRSQARMLLARQVPPEAVHWHTADAQNADLFADPALAADSRPHGTARAASAIVPVSFQLLCETVVLHQDPERFALLYRLLWRLVHEPGLRHAPNDPDMLLAHQMGQAVRRDIQKMKAYLRFRPVDDGRSPPLQLAWFEPVHHIVEVVAPWFAKRPAPARWVILTPERSVECDGLGLHFAPGLPRAQAPAAEADAGIWMDCYRKVFGSRARASYCSTPSW